MMRRLLLVPAFALAALAATAVPAAADPAGPTHYDSVVTGLDDPDGVAGGVAFEVLGGDAFLVIHAGSGTVVEVPGYDGEPYVRIDPDGAVHVNERSESRYLNDDRYAEAAVPPIADNDAPPSWVQVAEGGSYAWHDHRIHYMAPSLPRGVDPTADVPQPVWDWSVPFTVDGAAVEVTGELTWLPGPSPGLPIGAVVLVGALTVGAVLRWRSALVPVLTTGIAATAVIGVAKVSGLPPGADGEPALLVLPGIAAAALAFGAVLGRSRPSASLLVPAAGVPLLVWGILQSGALTRPIVPGPVAVEVVRMVVAIALAIGAAAVVAAARDTVSTTAVDDEEVPVGEEGSSGIG